MKALFYGTLPLFALATVQPAFAQDTPAEQPTVLETVIGKPQIKVLEDKNYAHTHYEKWQERTLVVLGNVTPSADGKTYVSREYKIPIFNLRIQSSQEEADFSKRWDALKEELSTITTATPQLKKWAISQYQSRSETAIPSQTFRPTTKNGYVSYAWVTRTIEMEGAQVADDTLYKATINVKVDKPTTKSLKAGRTFDTETGEIIAVTTNR